MMINILLVLAILPVALLCGYIYIKDTNKEPFKLVIKIFLLGIVMALPVVILEMFFDFFVTTDNVQNFLLLFFIVFVSIALVEEGGKWIITKFIGYDDKEFDEIYDIIVYSVFASLGFACIENVLYVLFNGISVALFRAILSVPGHMCFGVIMGYFLSKAKINYVNKNYGAYTRNLMFSLFVPALVHALYDTLIFHYSNTGYFTSLALFFIVDINMVVVCFVIVHIVSKMQTNINTNIGNGNIVNDRGNISYVSNDPDNIHYCPICGKSANNSRYCGRCGFKLK